MPDDAPAPDGRLLPRPPPKRLPKSVSDEGSPAPAPHRNGPDAGRDDEPGEAPSEPSDARAVPDDAVAERAPTPSSHQPAPAPDPMPSARPQTDRQPPSVDRAPQAAPNAVPDDNPEDRLEGLPKVLHRPVLALGERPLREVLYPLILDICRMREWTTAKQLAGWFSMHQRSLVHRHLGPMVDAGLLELQFPESPRSPCRRIAPAGEKRQTRVSGGKVCARGMGRREPIQHCVGPMRPTDRTLKNSRPVIASGEPPPCSHRGMPPPCDRHLERTPRIQDGVDTARTWLWRRSPHRRRATGRRSTATRHSAHTAREVQPLRNRGERRLCATVEPCGRSDRTARSPTGRLRRESSGPVVSRSRLPPPIVVARSAIRGTERLPAPHASLPDCPPSATEMRPRRALEAGAVLPRDPVHLWREPPRPMPRHAPTNLKRALFLSTPIQASIPLHTRRTTLAAVDVPLCMHHRPGPRAASSDNRLLVGNPLSGCRRHPDTAGRATSSDGRFNYQADDTSLRRAFDVPPLQTVVRGE